jgi:hypothetical protein
MNTVKLSKSLRDCHDWELSDQVTRFDSIVDSMMTTDVARDKLREELIDWQDEVENMVEELSAHQPYQGFREFAAMAEDLFGTEV